MQRGVERGLRGAKGKNKRLAEYHFRGSDPRVMRQRPICIVDFCTFDWLKESIGEDA